MGSRTRQNTTQNQTQSFNNRSTTNWGYMTPPDTPDVQRLRGQEFEVDPTISYRVGGALRRMRDRFNNPLGPYMTASQREAIARGEERELMQTGGQQFREGQFDVNRQNYARNLAVAGMTAPQLVQQGSESSGTGTMQGTSTGEVRGSPWATIGSIAGGVGSAASASL